MMTKRITIIEVKDYVGQEVTIGAWVANKSGKGKIAFLQLRDGTAFFQGVKLVSRLEDELFEQIDESYEGIVLDEILDAIALNLLNEGKVYDCLVSLKETHEVILTGRQPSHKLKPILDYSSEIKKHKHPYDKGIKARKGIEF